MSARKSTKKEKALTEDEVQKLLSALPPPTWDEVQKNRKFMRTRSKKFALAQIVEAMPASDPDTAYVESAAFLSTFLPSDGTELALSRLMVAATNTAMDCFARAKAEDAPVRDLELNYAARLALVTAALSKALDHHRGADWPDFIDDTIPPTRVRKTPAETSAESKGVQRNPESNGAAKPTDKEREQEGPSRSSA